MTHASSQKNGWRRVARPVAKPHGLQRPLAKIARTKRHHMTTMDPDFAQEIPKIELHLHLDGSLSPGNLTIFFKNFPA